MKNRATYLMVLILATLTINLHGQDWHWEWVNTNKKNLSNAWSSVIHADFFNNVYCRTSYDTALYFPDTSFHHPEQYHNNGNFVISKYSDQGAFIEALDLHTVPGGNITYPQLVTDSASCLYLCFPFRKKVFIKDTFLTIAPTPYPMHPDVLIAKVDENYDLMWSGLITSSVQDDLRGMVQTAEGDLVVSCIHHAVADPHQVKFLGQDTSAPYNKTMNSLTKIDQNGNLIWKKEIRSEYLGIDARDLVIGDNGMIYLLGTASNHFSIGNDTIHHPEPGAEPLRFHAVFNQAGELMDAYFFDWDIRLWEIQVDYDSHLYISGFIISDTAIIGNDTIFVPEGENFGIIGKFDPELNPEWYQIMENITLSRILLDGENLIFTTTVEGDVQIADTTLSIGGLSEAMIGEFDANGQLLNLQTTNCTHDLSIYFNIFDNCKNPVIGGSYVGKAIFGNDTISTDNYIISESLIAKLVRNEPSSIDLGPDSIYCEEYILQAPPGFHYYSWNDSITTQNWITINETETIHFACADMNGCWIYDTINIEIHPGITAGLGPDTTITKNDTIVFALPNHYESYLWFNGSTSNTVEIIGSDYEVGTYPVWVEVTDGPCIETDTLLLTIKSGFGIDETDVTGITIYPNPFTESFNLEIKPGYQAVEIRNLDGSIIRSHEINASNTTKLRINTKGLQRGIYLLNIKTRKQNLIKKIIKL